MVIDRIGAAFFTKAKSMLLVSRLLPTMQVSMKDFSEEFLRSVMETTRRPKMMLRTSTANLRSRY